MWKFSAQQTLVAFFHSCSVCEAEASWPSPLVRGRGPRRESGRWLPGHCHRGSASAPLPSSVRAEGHERSRTRADWRIPQNTVQRLVEKSTTRWLLTCYILVVLQIEISSHAVLQSHLVLCFCLCPRFPAGALSCGARTTAVPWQTGHSHGQDPARLWRLKQDHDGEFPCWLHARSWLWLLCKVLTNTWKLN